MASSLSIVIPALNERQNLPSLFKSLPLEALQAQGWCPEVLIVDNASTDGTGDMARKLGARVVEEPVRGYGNAYRTGLDHATGDVIATGDADLTYPFRALPELLETLTEGRYDFLTTDRMSAANHAAMCPSHVLANHLLSRLSSTLLRTPFRDSQSGMWVFRRQVWDHVDVRSCGMAFSQEIKNEAFLRGFRCAEVPIHYGVRGGEVKLAAGRDAFMNIAQLAGHRLRLGPAPSRPSRHEHIHAWLPRVDGFGERDSRRTDIRGLPQEAS